MENMKKWFVLWIGDDDGFDVYAESDDIDDIYQIIEEENLHFDEYRITEEEVF